MFNATNDKANSKAHMMKVRRQLSMPRDYSYILGIKTWPNLATMCPKEMISNLNDCYGCEHSQQNNKNHTSWRRHEHLWQRYLLAFNLFFLSMSVLRYFTDT